MVTKPKFETYVLANGSVLAKIFMVTKQYVFTGTSTLSSVLAKIFMVTKPQKYGSTFLNVIEY